MNAFLKRSAASMLMSSFLFSVSTAQTIESKFEAGINAGTYIYLGDLTPSDAGSFRTPGFAFGIHGSRKLNHSLALRLDLSLGRIRGNDASYSKPAWRKERAFKFKSPVKEIWASVVWNLRPEKKLQPYVLAGGGISRVRVNRDYSNFNAEFFSGENVNAGLATDISTSPPRTLIIFPVGMGIRYPLNQKISFTMEVSHRFLSTDYLDGYSKATNPDRADKYTRYTVGLIWNFRKSMLDCPTSN
jgi:hypothetical protein